MDWLIVLILIACALVVGGLIGAYIVVSIGASIFDDIIKGRYK